MRNVGNKINLALGGGGLRGIAYIGALEEAYDRRYRWGNIAGVSAGALVGSFLSSGMSPYEMWLNMGRFDFENVQLSKVSKEVPVIERYLEFTNRTRLLGPESFNLFFNQKINSNNATRKDNYFQEEYSRKSNFLKNIVTFSKEGSLFNGDYLEEWLERSLKAKGVYTFGDLRGGKVDEKNPKGYKLRITGVDANRAKLVIIPDDLSFYNIDPDSFSVAKAVRISSCVPFAFKPVELKKTEGNVTKTYNLIDGGILDRFPHWLIESKTAPAIGFTLKGKEKPGFFSINTAIEILKSMVTAIHGVEFPEKKENTIKYVGEIASSKISFMDFNLSDDDKIYLFNLGKQKSVALLDRFEKENRAKTGYRRKYRSIF